MAIAFVREHGGTAIDDNPSTVIIAGLVADVPAGNFLAFLWTVPNSSGTTPRVASVEVPTGETNTWQGHDYPSSSNEAGVGVVGGIQWIETTQQWDQSEQLTLTLDESTNRQLGRILEFSGVDPDGTNWGNVAIPTGTPEAAVTPTAAGQLVLGVAGWANGTTPTDDTDTVDGSWTTGTFLNTFNFMGMLSQHKIVTGTTQQLWGAVGSGECGGMLVAFPVAENGIGSASGTHAWAGVAEGGPPGPDNLQAVAASDTQIDLSWDALSGYTAYDIERDGVVIVSDHSTTSYSDTGLDADTEYVYRVRGVRYA